MTKRVLEEVGVDTTPLRSKSVKELLGRTTVKTAIVVCAQGGQVPPIVVHP